jgi:hypothetical protein
VGVSAAIVNHAFENDIGDIGFLLILDTLDIG